MIFGGVTAGATFDQTLSTIPAAMIEELKNAWTIPSG